jgi:hypothetical protein
MTVMNPLVLFSISAVVSHVHWRNAPKNGVHLLQLEQLIRHLVIREMRIAMQFHFVSQQQGLLLYP